MVRQGCLIVLHSLSLFHRQGPVQLFPSVWQRPHHGAEAHDRHAHRGGEQQVRRVPPQSPSSMRRAFQVTKCLPRPQFPKQTVTWGTFVCV